MKATLQLLIDGNSQIVEYYQNALKLWHEILEDPGIENVEELAQEVNIQKRNFELRCGGVPYAHEVMILAGIAQCFEECGELCESPSKLEAVLKALWNIHFGNSETSLLKDITKTYCLEGLVSFKDLVGHQRDYGF